MWTLSVSLLLESRLFEFVVGIRENEELSNLQRNEWVAPLFRPTADARRRGANSDTVQPAGGTVQRLL